MHFVACVLDPCWLVKGVQVMVLDPVRRNTVLCSAHGNANLRRLCSIEEKLGDPEGGDKQVIRRWGTEGLIVIRDQACRPHHRPPGRSRSWDGRGQLSCDGHVAIVRGCEHPGCTFLSLPSAKGHRLFFSLLPSPHVPCPPSVRALSTLSCCVGHDLKTEMKSNKGDSRC